MFDQEQTVCSLYKEINSRMTFLMTRRSKVQRAQILLLWHNMKTNSVCFTAETPNSFLSTERMSLLECVQPGFMRNHPIDSYEIEFKVPVKSERSWRRPPTPLALSLSRSHTLVPLSVFSVCVRCRAAAVSSTSPEPALGNKTHKQTCEFSSFFQFTHFLLSNLLFCNLNLLLPSWTTSYFLCFMCHLLVFF